MELTKQDSLKAKGVAIIGMIMLHLFCRLGNLPYVPLLWIGETPLIYYIGLFGDFCVPIYCFCSGYAHFLLWEIEPSTYAKRIPAKAGSFLYNYWIIVILFSLVGLIVNDNVIPESWHSFAGNIFLYDLSYNGSWWFVITYLLLLVLSPLCIYIIEKWSNWCVFIFSGTMYLVAYLFRFVLIFDFENVIIAWIWQQIILLGTSQFGYIIGMICYKNRLVTKTRNKYSGTSVIFKFILSFIFPLSAFLCHCVVQSLFVAPFTAMTVLIVLFVVKLPIIVERGLVFLGKHSGNIWFIHMFFYLTLFEGFVYIAKYPLLILLLMFLICIPCSILISIIGAKVKGIVI